ncbi:MAG: hypothetical protein H0U18_15695 [Pyrinomonadaceae bacterium]|nr:hypothetical protein [Pyrinomonadaceae bacterium]
MTVNYAEDNVMFVIAPPLQYKAANSPGKQGVEEWFGTWEGSLGYEIRDSNHGGRRRSLMPQPQQNERSKDRW